MIRTILNNEFNKLTGQELSDYEYTALIDYLNHYGELDWDTRDMRGAVADFINECYDKNELSPYATEDQEEYTIKNWWEFPMATIAVDGNKVITTYRGGTTMTYREVA
jgi:hypothetical protein